MSRLDPKHLPIIMQLVTITIVTWMASTASAGVDAAIDAAHRLPVVEQVVSDQGRRITRLESLDDKIGELSQNMAAVMAILKERP